MRIIRTTIAAVLAVTTALAVAARGNLQPGTQAGTTVTAPSARHRSPAVRVGLPTNRFRSEDFYGLGRTPERVHADVVAAPELIHSSACLLYTSPSPRDRTRYRMPSSA